MSVLPSRENTLQPIHGETDEVALVEPATEIISVEFTPSTEAEMTDWTYSATAENPSAAGVLDGTPGLIYNGPDNTYVRVAISEFDTVEHAIAAPEEADLAALSIYINEGAGVGDQQERVWYADEGFSEHSSETAVEHNFDKIIGPLNEGDVIRLAVSFQGEETDADLDLAPGVISIT